LEYLRGVRLTPPFSPSWSVSLRAWSSGMRTVRVIGLSFRAEQDDDGVAIEVESSAPLGFSKGGSRSGQR
jgi:hypothetical protein